MKSAILFFARNKLNVKDDLIFKSYEKAKKNNKVHIVDLFLNQINENRHYEITKNILSKI